MSNDYPDVPPWEPIAEWLAKHGCGGASDFEMEAKALAYEIATYDDKTNFPANSHE